jgi:UDP-GlcNAc3NAcA epimerase
MYDAALMFAKLAAKSSDVMARHALNRKGFLLATVHRAENTDDPSRLEAILLAFSRLASASCPLLLPLHPRTRATLKSRGLEPLLEQNSAVKLIAPVPFLDMIVLEQQAKLILTDSGGVQKEAYFQQVPCVTLRDETEWVETVEAGWNQLAGADAKRIEEAVAAAGPGRVIDQYGVGDAAGKVVELLLAQTQ